VRTLRPSGLVLAALLVTTAIGCAAHDDGTAGARTDEADMTVPAEPTTTSPTTGTPDGTFTVSTEVFVDPSRQTAGRQGRTLPTDIYVPGGTGPFPLIVHSHGYDGSSAKFSTLLGTWARAGFVVVAPNFPLTNAATPPAEKDLGDYVNQPRDVRFVLDEVLARVTPGGPFDGVVASDRIGASGLSLGGATTWPLVLSNCCGGERFDAALLMSAIELPVEGVLLDFARRVPTLVMAGTADVAVRYELQEATAVKLAGPSWFVTLVDGTHSAPFEDADSPQDDLVLTATTAFWQGTLRGDPGALERMASGVQVPGLSTLRAIP
jgi:dienelactone hydrolase